VTFVEMAAGVLLLSLLGCVPSTPSVFVWPSAQDLGLLALLASLFTLLPYALSLVAMRELSAFSVTLAVNLEPIYAMGLAALLFAEQRQLSALFYLGASIIVSSVFIAPWLTRARTRGAA
jgi:drug/metabolite transporter (DMT)-like permease